MENKKYAFFEVGGADCPFSYITATIPALDEYYQICFISKKELSKCNCKNCPHGKTKDELECIIAPIIKENQHMMGYKDEIVEALLGGEDK